MSEATASFVTFEDFLSGEQDSGRRHEWVGGQVYAMSGGTERHDLIAGLVYEALVAGARDRGCRTFMGNRLLHTRADSAYYPDLMGGAREGAARSLRDRSDAHCGGPVPVDA